MKQQPNIEQLGEPDAAAFRVIADAMPQLVWSTTPSGALEYVNRQWVDYTGFTREQVLSGGPESGIVHPDDLPAMLPLWNAALATATPFEIEYRLRRGIDGSYRWFLTRAVPILAEGGDVTRWIGTATDIDEQRRSRDSLRFMVGAGNILSASTDVREICESLAIVAIGHFADWCFVTLVRDGAIEQMAMAHKNKELLHYVEQYRNRYPTHPEDPLAQAIANNEPLLVERISPEQIDRAARDPEHLRLLRLLQMRSVMVVPLSTPAGKVHGALTVVSAESGHIFNAADLDVATAVASRAASAIENAMLLSEERNASQRLRFTARANGLLFETGDFWQTMERIAGMVAAEIADACAIVRLNGDAIRTEAVIHRDPESNAIVSRLRGQRTLRPEAERALAEQLRRHKSVVRGRDAEGDGLAEDVWPYLARDIEPLRSEATVIVPLYSGATTYGALAAYYSQANYEPARDLALLEEIAARASVAIERAETLERERRIATTLQQASLPSLIPQPEGLHFDAVYSPAGDEGEVGGDWYDAVELDDGAVVISVGDVTGRGIQAAAIMSKVRHAMGMVPRHERDPAKILDSAEWFLRKRYPDAIVTAFVAIISADRRTLHYANAGHLPPIVRRGGDLIALEAPGLPLGLRHLSSLDASQTFELRDRDLVVLYTDGLTEWDRNWARGERRLEEVLISDAVVASTSSAKLIERACIPDKAHDDVAILTVWVGSPPDWSFVAEDARAAADARQSFMRFLLDRTGDLDFVARAELVFGELLGNVVRHAPGPVEIQLCLSPESAVLHVIDSGAPFDFSDRLPDDMLSDFGRGLFIIRRLAKSVRVEYVANYGNHISVTL